MARGHVQHFTVLHLAAPVQGIVQVGRGVAALQPVDQQGGETGIAHAQQIGQGAATRRHAAACGCMASTGRAEERQFGRRGIAGKGAHHVQARDFQRTEFFTQCRFEGVFPAGLDVDAAPQAFKAFHSVL